MKRKKKPSLAGDDDDSTNEGGEVLAKMVVAKSGEANRQ